MEQIILLLHVLAAVGLIAFILLQQGKGAEVGASFGSGASQTFFGSQGSGSFLTRATAILVTVFFASSLTLGYLATHQNKTRDLDEILKTAEPAVPVETKDSDNDSDIPKIPKNDAVEQRNDAPIEKRSNPPRKKHNGKKGQDKGKIRDKGNKG